MFQTTKELNIAEGRKGKRSTKEKYKAQRKGYGAGP